MMDLFEVGRLGVHRKYQGMRIEDSNQVVDEGLFVVHRNSVLPEAGTTAEERSHLLQRAAMARPMDHCDEDTTDA